jgi:anti-sigma regulatory factor (Ser/Thr protein kinase)
MRATLAADLQAASQARAFVASHLGSQPVPHGVQVDDVLIVVGELVANAIQAGATSVDVDLEVLGRQLDVVVTDDAAGWPTPRTATEHDVNGRGLRIVGRLSDRWTVAARAVGKSVTATWFSQPQPQGGARTPR